MSDIDQFRTRVDTLHQQTMHIFDDLSKKTHQFELPQIPQELDQYRQKLVTNMYNVLVVGEAKRGKSTLVNALIGRDLLPTDVAIATNQVFRVSHATQEAYRLRFEDETTQEISAEELLKYGSQAVAAQQASSLFNLDLLRWIEVDVPIRFLPSGVNILDTPGMGSLYAAHAQITQRFIPRADAVIFVLDSNQPIVQFEIEFLEKILAVTHHVFFIQTKIDLYDKEDWQRVQKRNEEILQERFKDRLDDTRVWPFSSHNLLKAAQTNSSGLLKVSRQKELLEALEIFLFKVAGWNRCAEALLIADHYYTTLRTTLAERLTGLEAKSTQELTDIHQAAEQRQRQLDTEWGIDSKKQRELHSKVQKIANSSKRSMREMLEPDGGIGTSLRRKIDTVKSIDEANKLGMGLSEEVVTAVMHKWREICEQANSECSALLGSLIQDTNMLILPPESPNLVVRSEVGLDFQNDIWSKIDKAKTGFTIGTNTGITIALIAGPLIPLPIALIGIAIAGCLGAVQQWKYTAQSQLRLSQQKLYEHLSNVIQEARKSFLDSDPKYDEESLVIHYFNSLVHVMDEQIADIVDKKSKEAQQESVHLKEQSKLDKQQRLAGAEELRKQMVGWDELGRSIRATSDELQYLEPTSPAIAGM